MPLAGTVAPAPPGARGFDTAAALTAATARAFRTAGFDFAIRYLSRNSPQNNGDLSPAEGATILGAGLALMAVQHVAPAGWVPTQALGAASGSHAAANATAAGLPPGVNVWLDLEGIAAGTAAQDVIDYCNAWFTAVDAAGFATGVYVGANAILTSDQLHNDLTTQHYWRSGSRVPPVPTRGYQMVQTIDTTFRVAGITYDLNVTQTDNLGGAVLWLAPTAAIV